MQLQALRTKANSCFNTGVGGHGSDVQATSVPALITHRKARRGHGRGITDPQSESTTRRKTMNRNYRYEFVFQGWQSWLILILAGVGLIDICKETAKLIAPLIF